jgi:hypothetical protein
VQGQGLMAASNLSAGRGLHAEKSIAMLLDLKFDQLLIESLENHSNDVLVQASGLGVGAHMCKINSSWREALMTRKFPSLVIRALQTHAQVPNVQLWGLVAIANSSLSPVDNDTALEVANAVTEALKNHHNNSVVVGQVRSFVQSID